MVVRIVTYAAASREAARPWARQRPVDGKPSGSGLRNKNSELRALAEVYSFDDAEE